MKFLFICLLSGCSFLKAEVSSDQISKINTLLKQNADNIKAIQDILTPPQEEDCEVDFSAVKQPATPEESKKDVKSSNKETQQDDDNSKGDSSSEDSEPKENSDQEEGDED